MKTTFVRDIVDQSTIQDFFLIKYVDIKFGSNKKEYLDLIVGDNTGEISCKKWDIGEELEFLKSLQSGEIIKLRASVKEWNGNKQLTLTKLRKAIPNDNLKMQDFIKAAPEDPIDMFEFILQTANSLDDEELRNLCSSRLEREKERLLYYPAATRNHHAILGGLLYHMKRMLISGDKMCQVYDMLNRSLLLTGIIMHDMEKLNEIVSNEIGVANEYSFEGNLLGHLVLGVRELDREMRELGISREKAVMIEHMVLSHHYEPEFGSPKRPMFPEAELLHYLDVIDAKLYDMVEVLEKTEPEKFSDKVWTLDNRKLYRSTMFKSEMNRDSDSENKEKHRV